MKQTLLVMLSILGVSYICSTAQNVTGRATSAQIRNIPDRIRIRSRDIILKERGIRVRETFDGNLNISLCLVGDSERNSWEVNFEFIHPNPDLEAITSARTLKEFIRALHGGTILDLALILNTDGSESDIPLGGHDNYKLIDRITGIQASGARVLKDIIKAFGSYSGYNRERHDLEVIEEKIRVTFGLNMSNEHMYN